MINLVRILEDRTLLMSSKRIGVTGENNAEILKFIFPEKINSESSSLLSKKVYFYNDEISYSYPIENDEFKINSDLTIYDSLSVMVKIFRNNEMIFKTIPEQVYFIKAGNESEINPASVQRAADLSDLQNSFSANIGGNYSESEWDDLIGQFDNQHPEISYRSGILFNLRTDLDAIATYVSEMVTTDVLTINDGIQHIYMATHNIKSRIVGFLNDILNLDEPYDDSTDWFVLFNDVENLPASIQMQINEALAVAQESYISQLNSAIDNIVTLYSLNVSLDEGDTWATSLNNLLIVCAAIEDLGIIPSGSLTITEDGTYDVTEKATVVAENAELAIFNAALATATSTSKLFINYTGDLPYLNTANITNFAGFLGNALGKTVKINVSRATNIAAFEASAFEKITLVGSTANVATWTRAFSDCQNLVEIEGELDFTGCTSSPASIFLNDAKLKEIRLAPGSTSYSIGFNQSVNLSQTSLLSIVNGLADTTETAQTLTLPARGINRTDFTENWFCKKVEGVFVDCESSDEGALTYASAVTDATNGKGWILSWKN